MGSGDCRRGWVDGWGGASPISTSSLVSGSGAEGEVEGWTAGAGAGAGVGAVVLDFFAFLGFSCVVIASYDLSGIFLLEDKVIHIP